MNSITPFELVRSPILTDQHYALMDIPLKKEESHLLHGLIKSKKREILTERKYTKQELSFDPKNLRFGDLCMAKGHKQRQFLTFVQFSQILLVQRNWSPNMWL